MYELELLRANHEAAVLAFELENRVYFAQSVTDRGDRFFDHFSEEYADLLAEQATGLFAFYLLTDESGAVGRFNLYDIAEGTAIVGYRVAQRVTGQGVATSTLLELCRLARWHHGLRTLSAVVTEGNAASQRVLIKAGFNAAGRAQTPGGPGYRFELELEPADLR